MEFAPCNAGFCKIHNILSLLNNSRMHRNFLTVFEHTVGEQRCPDHRQTKCLIYATGSEAMRREMVLALGLAGLCGLMSAVYVNGWMATEFQRMKDLAEKPSEPAIALTKIVLAKQDIAFGVQLTRENLVEADWPVDNVPKGAFASVDAFLSEDKNRVALTAISTNEPIINERVTGPGQRSGLATMLAPGKKAVAIRVNEVVSVGGLVLPGDTIDIFVTNEAKTASVPQPNGTEAAAAEAYTDILLQNVRVLAVDQTLNPSHSEPILARTVTVEASLADAQKLTLAATIGSLSLVLRESSSAATSENLPRLTAADLPGNSGDKSAVGTMVQTIAVAPEAKTVAPPSPDPGPAKAKISVVRATTPTEYSVVRRE